MCSAETVLIPQPFHIEALTCSDTGITVRASSEAGTANCPRCGQASGRMHSRYHRTLADLPWCGITVRFRLGVRRWCCPNSACPQQVFAERLDGIARPWARRTERQRALLETIAFALGGEAGARLTHKLATPVSPDTLLRLTRGSPEVSRVTPTILGVDDWAWRKGQRYGTILVDLERHTVVDLLPDRSATSFATWLRAHPGIRVISRDRGGEYAAGAKHGAPYAVQVADRFHLLKNFAEVVDRVLRRHGHLVQQVPLPTAIDWVRAPPRREREAAHERAHQKTEARHTLVHTMAAAGLSQRGIARATGLNRWTVRRYLAATGVPERPRGTRGTTILTPYLPYLLERWRQGCHNAMGLWREIVALGYPGSHRNVSRLAAYLRTQAQGDAPLVLPPAGLTPRQALGLLVRRPEQRSPLQQVAVRQLHDLHPDIASSVALFEAFAALIRQRSEHPEGPLTNWMQMARESGVAEVQAFAVKLRQDWFAVVAGMRLPWSQGQTEGQVLRLKLIRRQMYGRGNFDLVRTRALHVG